MGFKARMNLPNWEPPVRAYLHDSGVGFYKNIWDARNYLLEVLGKDKENVSKYNFILAALWGKTEDDSKIKKIIDFIALSDIDETRWPGNPEVSAWVVENGVYVPKKEITCGDGLIMASEEEKFRRTTSGIEEFKKNYPDMGDLEPELSIEFQHSPSKHILETK